MKDIHEISNKINDAFVKMQESKGPAVYTPLTKSVALSKLLKANVYLKEENRQHTGSFKYRGALHKILTLSPTQQAKGIVTASSGNHGMACAYAASQLNIQCEVFLPASASPLKIEKIEALGARIQKVEGDCLQAELAAQKAAVERASCYLSPYNDVDVIAGQGTIGFEMCQQLSQIDQVYVSVGGGGLISGIGSAIKTQNNQNQTSTEIIACWPEHSPVMYECLRANKVVHVDEKDTLSDGTAGNVEENTCTLPLCQSLIDHSILVSEREIKRSILFMLEQEQLLIEGAAAVAVASAIQNSEKCKEKNIVIVVCGKNIAMKTLKNLICEPS